LIRAVRVAMFDFEAAARLLSAGEGGAGLLSCADRSVVGVCGLSY
jgi:hypothetical protein